MPLFYRNSYFVTHRREHETKQVLAFKKYIVLMREAFAFAFKKLFIEK